MTDREIMQMALDALEAALSDDQPYISRSKETVEALRSRLVQPEPEPFEYWNAVEGWVKIDEVRQHFDTAGCGTIYKTDGEGRVPLYSTPQREVYCGCGDEIVAGDGARCGTCVAVKYKEKEWKGLTEEEIIRLRHLYDPTAHWSLDMFARAIEAKLKEKNG